MSNAGKPRKSNKALALGGSRNEKEEVMESDEIDDHYPIPQFLSREAQNHWLSLRNTLTVCKLDVHALCILATLQARFYDDSVYGDGYPEELRGQPKVSEESRERITKQMLDLYDRFFMNPRARSQSGISKKTMGVRQRP